MTVVATSAFFGTSKARKQASIADEKCFDIELWVKEGESFVEEFGFIDLQNNIGVTFTFLTITSQL